MGQGQDKIARSLMELQPTAIVELFLLYFNTVDKETSFIAFHGGAVFDKGITWQGVAYLPIPVETEGFEINANGKMARPKIRVSNKDYFITDLLLQNQDLQFAKLIRKRTFVKYLDDVNFDGGNPWGQADSSAEISNDTYVISQKVLENKVLVEFELSSPLDLENFEINNRLVLARYCSWYYRGNGCNYQGPPIESEAGVPIIMNPTSINAWGALSTTSKWQTGIAYNSGDPVYLENKRIIIHPDRNNYSLTGVPKIWYVCQSGHTSSDSAQPDLNTTYWLRDGCNKKLDGCKKRFQNSWEQVIPSVQYSLTNNFFSMVHKNGTSGSNNIVQQASVTGSSQNISGFAVSNLINGSTGYSSSALDTGYSWVTTATDTSGVATLTWPTLRTINRIDVYGRPIAPSFGNAKISLFSGSSLLASTGLSSIGLGTRNTWSFNPTGVTSIQVSGGAGIGGYGEVSVFEPSGVGLYAPSFSGSGIHNKQNFHIGSWFQFPNDVSQSNQLLNIFHNVKLNCQYSGVNLYTSGGRNLNLDFATVEISGNPAVAYTRQRTLQVPCDVRVLQPIHIECVGGQGTGSIPTAFQEGYIRVRGLTQDYRYTLKQKNAGTNYSGEFFVFKNSSYASGVGDLKFGLNDWQFSDSLATPYKTNLVFSNLKISSNFILGTTAVWTGIPIQAKYDVFNRQDTDHAAYTADVTPPFPRKYTEVSGLNYMTGDLFAWWGMDLSNSPPYVIASDNYPTQTGYLTGAYYAGMDATKTSSMFQKGSIVQTNKTSLPFGGFPGTDKYGA